MGKPAERSSPSDRRSARKRPGSGANHALGPARRATGALSRIPPGSPAKPEPLGSADGRHANRQLARHGAGTRTGYDRTGGGTGIDRRRQGSSREHPGRRRSGSPTTRLRRLRPRTFGKGRPFAVPGDRQIHRDPSRGRPPACPAHDQSPSARNLRTRTRTGHLHRSHQGRRPRAIRRGQSRSRVDGPAGQAGRSHLHCGRRLALRPHQPARQGRAPRLLGHVVSALCRGSSRTGRHL